MYNSEIALVLEYGLVNGAGRAIAGASEVMRRVQTGSVRAYAASLFLGVVLILGYYLWR